ncbi:M15 family metallopeptidase [Curtobacterium sp. RRHDQ66]|uniref:M15 family metallopeptidase n=1 Tax=Curtobacterium guangdongense TaxID=3413380 RepID=UPI003BF28AF7
MPHGGKQLQPISRRTAIGAMGLLAGVAVAGVPLFTARPALAVGRWGQYENGKIPLEALTVIPWATSQRLRSDATQALVALNKAFVAARGGNLPITEAYRNYARQQELRDYWCSQGSCELAALPGSSNHGWALAIDVTIGRLDWNHPTYLWLKANAGKYGWEHPAGAEPGGSYPEAWHWEYNGTYVPFEPPKSEEDDDMATNVITVSVPDGGTGQVWWSVNLGDNTKARIWNGTQLTFRRNIGIPEYSNQPPQTLQGFKDISTT